MTAYAPPFRVTVELTPHLWPQGYEYALDGPADGSIAEAFSVELSGFILRPRELRRLSRPEALRFRVLGSVIWRCTVDLPRPDLLQSSRFRDIVDEQDIYCGFNTILPAFLTPAATPIEILVSVGQGDEEKSEFCFGLVSFTPTNRQAQKFNSISVVNVNSIGRSGSSLLCKIFDSHPAFFVPKLFGQYGEVSIVNHYLRAISVLCSSGAASHLNGFEILRRFPGDARRVSASGFHLPAKRRPDLFPDEDYARIDARDAQVSVGRSRQVRPPIETAMLVLGREDVELSELAHWSGPDQQYERNIAC